MTEGNDIKTDSIGKSLRIMEVVEKELEQQKNDSIFCLLMSVCVLCIWALFYAVWDYLGRPFPNSTASIGIEIIAIVMLIIIKKCTHLKIRKMGITRKNLKPTMIRSAIISAICVIIMVVIKLIRNPSEPLRWSTFHYYYILRCILQEFLARGFLVTTLYNILPAKYSRHMSVICSSLMFSALHIFYGFLPMLGAGVISVLCGYIYLKDENIWGVSLFHFVLGTFANLLGIVQL